jgi:hypothetical protein
MGFRQVQGVVWERFAGNRPSFAAPTAWRTWSCSYIMKHLRGHQTHRRTIAIRHLLTHASGIPDICRNPESGDPAKSVTKLALDRGTDLAEATTPKAPNKNALSNQRLEGPPYRDLQPPLVQRS